MAHWYTAPVIDTTGEDPENGTCRPDGGPDGIERVHAYDPPGAPTTCLVGAKNAVTIAGWTSLTLQQAKDHFNAFYGRQPTDAEVY